MARPRVAAGALFVDDQDRVLLVKPTYKESWDIPGGYVEPGESPYQACIREVREELGITPPIGELLVVDWAPNHTEGDKLLFVFDGGILTKQLSQEVRLPSSELLDCDFVENAEIKFLLTERLARRIREALDARNQSLGLYLEAGSQPHGIPHRLEHAHDVTRQLRGAPQGGES